MTTPRLGAPELTAGQATPETTVNEQVRYLESAAGHFIFKDRDLATPPGSPADGDCYLVKATGTGAWSGKDGKIAFYLNTAWVFITPIEGFTAWVNDEDIFISYDGAAWNTFAQAAEATDSEVWTGSSTTTRVSPRRIFTAAAPVALTDGATITIDGNTGINFKVTLGGSRTLANPTNMKTGQSGIIIVTQDGTGSRVLSYGTNWKFPGGAATGGVLSTAASSVDVISYFVRSDGTILASLQKAFS